MELTATTVPALAVCPIRLHFAVVPGAILAGGSCGR